MTQLGNVFEGLESDQPRGPDLRVSIEVPREALGGSLRARVPMRLAADGDLVDRVSTTDDPEHVTLHLPPELPAGAVLRLRGQGGVRPGEQPGDLFVAIELVERPMTVDERASMPQWSANPEPVRTSGMLTWWILLGLAGVAATTVWALFG